MSLERRDYVERLIEQLAAVVARLVEQLGPLAAALPQVDAASAVALLRDPRQVRAWAQLLRVEAEARTLRGEDALARALEARAADLARALTAAAAAPAGGGTPPPRPAPPR